MSDDLDYVKAHVPGYRGYDSEEALHDSDQRVRARVGELLSEARDRLGAKLDPATTAALDAAILRCMFGDQKFIRELDHATLDDAAKAKIVRCDRTLIQFGEDAFVDDAAALLATLADLDAEFERRHSPALLTG